MRNDRDQRPIKVPITELPQGAIPRVAEVSVRGKLLVVDGRMNLRKANDLAGSIEESPRVHRRAEYTAGPDFPPV
jgi:hypothetical protein